MAFTPDLQSDSGNTEITGNLSVQDLAANGNVVLGNVANVHIYNGSNGQVLRTDGLGNLNWGTVLGEKIFNGTSNVDVSENANVTVSINGVANIAQFTSDGLSVLGNSSANNFISSNAVTVSGRLTAANANIAGTANIALVTTTTIAADTGPITIQSGAVGNHDVNLQPSGTGGVNVGSKRVINVGSPTDASDAATKSYVDSNRQGLVVKAPVDYATVAPLNPYTYDNGVAGVGATLTSTSTEQLIIDGSIPVIGQRILVKNELSAAQAYNGIYVVVTQGDGATTSWQMIRANDFNLNVDMYAGYAYVIGGVQNAYSSWVCTNNPVNDPINVGSSSILFVQFTVASQYIAGPGINFNGTAIGANTDGITTSIVGGNVVVKPSAQLTTPNIGIATGESLTTTGDVVVGGNANVSGNVNAANIFGDTLVTNLIQANVSVTAPLLVATASVTSAGTITAGGNIAGNNATVSNILSSSTLEVSNNATIIGNTTSGNLLVTGVATVGGTATVGNLSTTGFITAGGNVSAGNVAATGAQFSGNVTAGNVTATDSVTATSLTGSITTAAQPNITSVGTLTGLQVAGNSVLGSNTNVSITGGTYGQVLATDGSGNLNWATVTVTAGGSNTEVQYNNDGNFAGSPGFTYNATTQTMTVGSVVTETAVLGTVANVKIDGGTAGFVLQTVDGQANLTWVNPASIPANISNVANYAANVTVAAQPNITSVGTLTGLTVSGTTSLTGVIASSITADTVTAASLVGNIVTANQPNITGVGTLGNLTVSGNVTSGSVVANTLTSTVGNGTAPLSVTSVTRVANLNVDRAAVSDQATVQQAASGVLYPVFAGDSSTGNRSLQTTAGLSYDVDTGVLTSTSFSGNLSGNALLAASVTVNSQPNITSVGTLTGIIVNGISALGNAGNVKIEGGINGQYLTTDGFGNLSWVNTSVVAGSNRAIQFNDDGYPGGVNALEFDKTSNTLTTNTIVTTTSANLGAVGNVTITGGIANQVLKTDGNGVLAWANVDTILVTPGSNTQVQFSDDDVLNGATDLTYDKTTGTTTAGKLVVSGTSNLGNLGNVTITGGTNGYVLSTDGAGNLSWTAQTGGSNGTPGGANTEVQFNDDGNFAGNASFTFNKAGGTLSVPAITVTDNSNLGNVANVVITGGTSGQYLRTDGTGALTWDTVTGTAANPAGANTQLQFNNGTGFGASVLLRFNSSNGALFIGNSTSNALTTVVGGFITTSNAITARAITLEAAQGNAPLRVFSNTQVPNLNVTFLQGYQPSIASTANTIVARDANASFQANVIGATTLTVGNTGVVANLNATRVGNYAPNLTAQANTIPVRDAAGNVYINQTVGNLYGTVVGVAQSDSIFGTKLDIANVRMASTSTARIMAGGNTSNGFLEISTGNASIGDTSTIYVRQYSGVTGGSPFTGITREAKLLDSTGKTTFPISVTVPSVIANIVGDTGNFNRITVNANVVASNAFLGNLTITGNKIEFSQSSGGAWYSNGYISTPGGINTSGNITGTNVYANSGEVRASTLTGTISAASASQPNITQVGNLVNLNVAGNTVFGNNITSNGVITGQRYVSTVAQGTAPMTVNSNTQVANLNASLLAGKSATFQVIPDTIVLRDVNGNVNGRGGQFFAQVYFLENGAGNSPIVVSSRVKVDNLNSDLLDGFSADTASAANTVAVRDASGYINATRVVTTQLQSIAASGTSPLLVNSQTQVPNLNASLLGGFSASQTSAASTVAVRDSSGNIVATGLTYSGQLTSQTTSTAPFNVSSTILNANLNSELLGGYRASTQNLPSTVAVRDAAGILYANAIQLANIVTAPTANVTTVNATTVAASGNITAANIIANANIRMDGNSFSAVNANAAFNTITANSFNITGFSSGNSNVFISGPGGNVNLSASGVANVLQVSSTAVVSRANIQVANGAIIASQGRFTTNTTGNNIFVGDDVILGDVDKSNQLNIKGQQDGNQGWVSFGNSYTTGNPAAVIGQDVIGSNTNPSAAKIQVMGQLQVNLSRTGFDQRKTIELRGNGTTPGTQAWIGTVPGTQQPAGTISISNDDSSYGGLVFGQGGTALSRTGSGPLTWSGDWSFSGVTANATTVSIDRTLSLSQGSLTVQNLTTLGNLQITSNANMVVPGVGTVQLGYRTLPTSSIAAGSSTLQQIDSSKLLIKRGAASTVTIPPNSSVPFEIGTVVILYNTTTTALNISRGSGVTLILTGTGAITGATINQYGQISLLKVDTDTWSATGVGFNTTLA
jgi:hypothetical protein